MSSIFRQGVPGLARSAFSLIGSRFLVGFGEGAYPTSCSVAIVDHFQKKARARAKSVISAGASVGFAGFVLALFLWIVIQQTDKKKDAKGQKKSKGKSVVKVSLKNPLVWKLMVAACFTNMVFWGLQSWLPTSG